MTRRLLLPCALAVLALAACGEDEPAPAAKVDPVADAPAASAPESGAQAAAAEAAPAAAARRAQAISTFPARNMPVTMAHDEIGVQPAKNIQDAFNTANIAMDRFCEQTGMNRAEFYIKDTTQAADKWTVTFFGAPEGEAMYVTMYVFPDGRYEIIRN